LHEWFILYNVYKAHKQSKKVVVSQYWKDCVASAVVSHVVHRIPAELFKEMRLLF
jgi:hypothetical protein